MFLRFALQLFLFWFVVFLCNHLLLRFRVTRRPYLRFLRLFGCHISLCNIMFYTTAFNRLFYRIGSKNARLWKIWFTLGIIVTVIIAVCACATLVFLPIRYAYELSQRSDTVSSENLTMTKQNERDKLLIQPIIPGVNVPLDQIVHFFFALLVCTVFHEFGHAVAATAEQVRLNGCGYFLFLLYPGAYVDLNHEQVEMISAYRQLRIYCAGVYHNLVLVLFALGFLLMNPFFVRNFYTETAMVSRVVKESPLAHSLPVYSTIQSIDGCIVNTANDWYQCLRLIRDRRPQDSSGYCLAQAEIQQFSSHTEYNQTINHDCCQNLSQKNYCFLYHLKQHSSEIGACMEARTVTQHPVCFLNSDCQRYGSDSSCVYPFTADNITRLIRISHSQGPSILFVGSINEIYRTITLQSYRAKYNFIPTILITDIPLFFQYVGAFSFALAFFNAVPCYGLDGQYILSALIEYYSPNLHRQHRARLTFALIIGTGLLALNVLLAFVRYFLL
ncbi:unnamed protein product [Adineta ricciae]|uniref:Membrane-bound transcription factor site-2 protease n=2 Tax=Adineta ricciae TaxID=249248 RepID=A0A814K811_ADIRI|nr:unnamed protein product [Adineta ricciae]